MAEDPVTGVPDPPVGGEHVGSLVQRLQLYLEELRRHETPQSEERVEWDRLFDQQSRVFLRLVRSRCWLEQDREDDVQELWLMLINRLPALRYEPIRGQLSDWILAIASHRLPDQGRYRRCRSMKRLSSAAAARVVSREPDPAVTFECGCLVTLVRETLAELRMQVPQRDYEAFELRWLQELSVRDVANKLGMTESQVWASHHRMITKLRPLLTRRLRTQTRPFV